MASPSISFKTPNSIHIFTMKAPSSLTSTKLKTLFQTFLFSHMYPISRVLGKAKSFLLKLAKDAHVAIHLVEFPIIWKRKNKNNKQKKLFFGSFRLHYNWCSSNVMSLGQESYDTNSFPHVYYDSSWNRVVKPTPFDNYYHRQMAAAAAQERGDDDELSRYLQWLEEKKGTSHDHAECNEIDKLADLFIANCHEKFRLEKQESYRRFQEMMTTST